MDGQEGGVTELNLLWPEVGALLILGCCCLDRAVADDGRQGGTERDLGSRWREARREVLRDFVFAMPQRRGRRREALSSSAMASRCLSIVERCDWE